MPNVIILGGGACGGCLIYGGGALMNGISTLVKETPPELPSPFRHVRLQHSDSHLGSSFSPVTECAGAMNAGFLASRTVRSNF